MVTGALPVLAQGAPPVADLEHLWLDGGGRGALFTPGGRVLPAKALRVGAATFFTQGQLRAPGGAAPLVAERLGFQVFGAAGVLPWLEVGAVVPVVAGQTGAAGLELASAGLGNPWLHARAQVAGHEAPVSVALGLGLAVPVGTDQALGNGGFEFAPRLSLGRAFEGWQVAAEVGLLLRPRVDFSAVAGTEGVVTSSQAWLAAALTALPERGPRGELSVRAFAPLQGGRAGVEAQVGVRWPAGPVELFASAGPGFGGEPSTPLLRAYLGFAFSSVPPPAPTEPPPAAPLPAPEAPAPEPPPEAPDVVLDGREGAPQGSPHE